MQRLAWTINVAFGGVRNGRFTDKDKRYDVRVRLLEQQRELPEQLRHLYVKTQAGKLVPLADVADTKIISTLPKINPERHGFCVRPLPPCAAGEAVLWLAEATERAGTPPFGLVDPCRLVRQVKQFYG